MLLQDNNATAALHDKSNRNERCHHSFHQSRIIPSCSFFPLKITAVPAEFGRYVRSELVKRVPPPVNSVEGLFSATTKE